MLPSVMVCTDTGHHCTAPPLAQHWQQLALRKSCQRRSALKFNVGLRNRREHSNYSFFGGFPKSFLHPWNSFVLPMWLHPYYFQAFILHIIPEAILQAGAFREMVFLPACMAQCLLFTRHKEIEVVSLYVRYLYGVYWCYYTNHAQRL